MADQTNFNLLTLKTLLLDTITYLKFGSHLAPNYKAAKYSLCDLSGQKRTITNKQLLHLIGTVYKDNDKESDFWAVIDKFNAAKFLN